MQVIRAGEGSTEEATGRPIFEGGQVWRRGLAGPDAGEGADFSMAVVQFGAGARTKTHRHSSDQMLYVVAGIGKVGDGSGAHQISVGDFVLIPADADHWHGAADTGSPMSHLAITRSDSVTTVTE